MTIPNRLPRMLRLDDGAGSPHSAALLTTMPQVRTDVTAPTIGLLLRDTPYDLDRWATTDRSFWANALGQAALDRFLATNAEAPKGTFFKERDRVRFRLARDGQTDPLDLETFRSSVSQVSNRLFLRPLSAFQHRLNTQTLVDIDSQWQRRADVIHDPYVYNGEEVYPSDRTGSSDGAYPIFRSPAAEMEIAMTMAGFETCYYNTKSELETSALPTMAWGAGAALLSDDIIRADLDWIQANWDDVYDAAGHDICSNWDHLSVDTIEGNADSGMGNLTNRVIRKAMEDPTYVYFAVATCSVADKDELGYEWWTESTLFVTRRKRTIFDGSMILYMRNARGIVHASYDAYAAIPNCYRVWQDGVDESALLSSDVTDLAADLHSMLGLSDVEGDDAEATSLKTQAAAYFLPTGNKDYYVYGWQANADLIDFEFEGGSLAIPGHGVPRYELTEVRRDTFFSFETFREMMEAYASANPDTAQQAETATALATAIEKYEEQGIPHLHAISFPRLEVRNNKLFDNSPFDGDTIWRELDLRSNVDGQDRTFSDCVGSTDYIASVMRVQAGNAGAFGFLADLTGGDDLVAGTPEASDYEDDSTASEDIPGLSRYTLALSYGSNDVAARATAIFFDVTTSYNQLPRLLVSADMISFAGRV